MSDHAIGVIGLGRFGFGKIIRRNNAAIVWITAAIGALLIAYGVLDPFAT